MSRFSPEQVVIAFAPSALHALRLEGRYRLRLVDECSIPLAVGEMSRWSAAIDALELLLDDPAWGDRETCITLSCHYVYYAVLPKGEGLGETERYDLARLIFRTIFGDLARDWEIRVSPGGPQPALASGIPRELLQQLRAICAGRAELTSIQPGLMPVFNRARAVIGKHSGVLALVEPGRITLATLRNGQWQAVFSRAGAGSDLPGFLDENLALAGEAPGTASEQLWLCDLSGRVSLPPSPPWRVEPLSPGAIKTHGASLADWGCP